MADSPKPEPYPTKVRLAFAAAIKAGRVVKHQNNWWNTIAGRKCNAALAEFAHLVTDRTDEENVIRAVFTPDGVAWLDTYGKNGADTP